MYSIPYHVTDHHIIDTLYILHLIPENINSCLWIVWYLSSFSRMPFTDLCHLIHHEDSATTSLPHRLRQLSMFPAKATLTMWKSRQGLSRSQYLPALPVTVLIIIIIRAEPPPRTTTPRWYIHVLFDDTGAARFLAGKVPIWAAAPRTVHCAFISRTGTQQAILLYVIFLMVHAENTRKFCFRKKRPGNLLHLVPSGVILPARWSLSGHIDHS